MTAVRSFQLAVQETTDSEYEPIPYEFGDAQGNKRIVTAHHPGEEALLLLVASGTEDGAEAATELFSALKAMFPEGDDYQFIKARFRTRELTLDTIMEIFEDAMERWTSFPTESPSASRAERRSTGTRSTGRSPGKGSTLSREA